MAVKTPFLPLFNAAALVLLSACSASPDPSAEAARLQTTFAGSNRFVSEAIAALKTNDVPAAVLALENARSVPGLTADQLMSLQKTKQAMTADLVAKAEHGDRKAQADLALLERLRSQ